MERDDQGGMDCRRFRRDHPAYVDDTLAGVRMQAMRLHLEQCEACAAHDSRVRRALMLVRSSAPVALSAEFSDRLAARLSAERLRPRPSHVVARWRRPRVLATAAALVVCAGGMTAVAASRAAPAIAPIAMAPIVVTPPALPPEPLAAPAMLGTVTTGLPVFSALLMARRATEQFAETHARTVSFQAAR